MAKPWTDKPAKKTLESRHGRGTCDPATCKTCLNGFTASRGAATRRAAEKRAANLAAGIAPKPRKPRQPTVPKPKPAAPSPIRLGLGEELLGDLLGELAEARTDTALNIVWAHRNSLLPLMCTSDKERTQRVWELQYQILACSPRFRKPAPPPEPVRQRRAPPPIVIEREPPKGIFARLFGGKSSRVYATTASWGARELFVRIAEKATRTA